jgi:hypothetical protein
VSGVWVIQANDVVCEMLAPEPRNDGIGHRRRVPDAVLAAGD